MKCLNCESELFENEFKDLQCTNCGSIYPFSNKGLSNGGCAKTEDIIDLINCLEARIGVYETCNARKDEAIKHLEREVKRLQAENEELVGNIDKLEEENEKQYEIARDTIRAEIADGGTSCHWCEDTIRGIAKAEAYKECIENVKPIIREIVDLMFDDNASKCRIDKCRYTSNVACGNEVCLTENRAFWNSKLDNLLKEMVGD